MLIFRQKEKKRNNPNQVSAVGGKGGGGGDKFSGRGGKKKRGPLPIKQSKGGEEYLWVGGGVYHKHNHILPIEKKDILKLQGGEMFFLS